MQAHKPQVLSRYRELLRLIQRLPSSKAAAARAEAQQTIRQRQHEADPEQQLQHLKELAAKIGFLRITTPRRPGEALDSGSFVLRDGQLVKGSGEQKGTRAADGTMTMEAAQQKNREHYKRFYGKPMAKDMIF
ncbi:hypothetical protein OEZ85_002570 [Tetradesmus obliquus]|uniref:Complex 1 LYR protein domain-containing protein n=1 Tax=Tetradesmus obliquus TaxID=3088 RepID=A0ABY8TXX0_TETOB|nr:hypothetical protein OEZ85_002570 [Tetradesmus obliquus]